MNPQKILRLEVWQATDNPQNCQAVFVVENELHQITSDVEGFERWLLTWGYITSDDQTELVLHNLKKVLERSLRSREVHSVTWPATGNEWKIAPV